MTIPAETWPVNLTVSQADDLVMLAVEEGIVEAERGDPRNVTGDCTAIKQAIRSRLREGDRRVEAALTARQWDVTVAALDRNVLRTLRNGEPDVADSFTKARDTVLAQVAEHLPSHTRQNATARHRLTVEDAYGYLLFQPSRRGRYIFGSGNAPTLDDLGTPSLSTIGIGKAAIAQVRSREVNVEVQVLPEAPEPDYAAWESIAEITQQWTSFPYPELVLAVPGQDGTVLWDLTTDLWPHVTYRMRLSINASGLAAEDHLLQMWPAHTAPPAVHKPI
ncbi:hypothetical protein [Actinomadura sp. 9N407]|uniref:hypothetical protein n=1 Tax=Actinomadura sp. 9N407 TaxID=3375154 RepID=UPI0037AECB58